MLSLLSRADLFAVCVCGWWWENQVTSRPALEASKEHCLPFRRDHTALQFVCRLSPPAAGKCLPSPSQSKIPDHSRPPPRIPNDPFWIPLVRFRAAWITANPEKQAATAAPCKPRDAETAFADSSLPLKLRRLITGERTAPWTDKRTGQTESCILGSAQRQNPPSPNFTCLHLQLRSRIGSTAAFWGGGKGKRGAKGPCD